MGISGNGSVGHECIDTSKNFCLHPPNVLIEVLRHEISLKNGTAHGRTTTLFESTMRRREVVLEIEPALICYRLGKPSSEGLFKILGLAHDIQAHVNNLGVSLGQAGSLGKFN